MEHNQTPNYNLQEILSADIRTEIPPETVTTITSQRPFVTIQGLFNIRDISSGNLRPGYAYRSGFLSNISDEGKTSLRDVGISTIFDLRRHDERTKSPSPAIEGVETVWEPYTRDPEPTNPLDFKEEDQGVSGFLNMFMCIVEISTPVFRKVFLHIRDCPQRPFLFHCTAGRDRTGVLAALILLLADTPSDAIVHDFILSRVGIEPARKMLMAAFPTLSGAVTPESTGWLELMSVRAPAMVAFLDTVEQSFGGVKGYLTGILGFSNEDVEIMRVNLRGN
ncbi:protein-tyrosine phosphatase-like protein [Aspergillus caelatus]|uniref:Protein-tyrosine phosphatase-like protein n=1 Tax=Aspergillus caelatus TaxID=61420 RepID=A0A5N6ZQZ0_9EURO|nr:protein-tyrosine phosphatase-like protein [Aspergillus caelatus]KAE8359386.1 protein-tyrosine phosphatase-like protein [Aspergillus caelatus]